MNTIKKIEYGLYDRSTAEEKTHNFPKVLPPVQSELAIQTLKDPYIFDFLTLAKDYKELVYYYVMKRIKLKQNMH